MTTRVQSEADAMDPEERRKKHPNWGGARAGAGRPRTSDQMPHTPRPEHDPRHPVQVVLRIRKGLPSLRGKAAFEVVRGGLEEGSDRLGFRLVHYSVHRDQLRLIVEAESRKALTAGLKGLQIRLARRLNRLLRGKGRVFADRYEATALVSPQAVHAGLVDVLNHARTRGPQRAPEWMDPKSTAPEFYASGRGLAPCRTWLLRTSWKRVGAITPDLVPAPVDG